jgi:hypothetical protein
LAQERHRLRDAAPALPQLRRRGVETVILAAFHDPASTDGMSSTMRRFVGGLLETSRPLEAG